MSQGAEKRDQVVVVSTVQRIVVGLLCLAFGTGCGWLAISSAESGSSGVLLFALGLMFFSITYAAWFYPWPSQLSEASKRILTVELTAESDAGFIEIGRDTRVLAMPRKCGVLVDGEKVGELGVEEVIRVRVSPGEHSVQARLSWVVSSPCVVSVRAGDTVRRYFALPRLSEIDRAVLGPFQGSIYFQWR
ncbi:MAG: hypothetical protein ABL932_18845 [Terricaulis sp.]